MTVDHLDPAASHALVGVVIGDSGEPLAVTGPRGTSTARLIGAATTDLAEHHARCGPIPWRGPGGALLRDLRDAGLTGRGDAAVPTWRELATTAEAAGRRAAAGWPRDGAAHPGGPPVVVANAAEGEPESAKDTTLLTAAPHLVLDGVQLAAEAVGATEAFVVVAPGLGAQAVRRALTERHRAGWDRCPTRVHELASTFLAGEASAITAALAGGAPRPHDHWRPLAEQGPHGRPTAVQNVETLAHLGTIARWGAGWFRAVGTPDEPGTFLVTVTGAVRTPGVVEVAGATALAAVIDVAGGASEPVGALRVGGYSGTWLPAGAALSRPALSAGDGAPGPGIVTVLPADACGLAETARIVDYLAARGAGQCGPCVSGLPQLALAAASMAAVAGRDPAVRGEDPATAASRALRLSALVGGRGACQHPEGVARLVRSALRTFAADIRAHTEGYCRGACAPPARPSTPG